MNLPFLPTEIWCIIIEFKELLEISVPGTYIIRKTINNKIKEQIATIDNRYKLSNLNYIYEYNYGVYGFHEGCCKFDQIRTLSETENKLAKENLFLNLPQQFYQSIRIIFDD